MRRVFILIGFMLATSAWAGEVYIPVGAARVKRSVLAFPNTKLATAGLDGGDPHGIVRLVHDVITSDLDFTNLFTMQSPAAFIEKSDAGMTLDTFHISDWTTIGTEFLIKTSVTFSGENIAYELRLFDVLGSKEILAKRYVAKQNEPKVLAHTVANELVQALTGRYGIFFSKISMVCDKTGHKEIWAMDFDGSNPRQITNHRSLSFSPAWSPDNRRIAYSLYTKNGRNVKNIDLYEIDLSSRRARLLSNRKGINSGASYSPDGRSLILTMSFLGNPDIFLLDQSSSEVTRLTRSLGTDVDPAFSPDGKRIAFVSTRSGPPMVFTGDIDAMKTNPASSTRLTFAGMYNATPTWSPMGDKIAFASDLGSHFDLFMMGTDGSSLERLTKNEGNNEDPNFSPDGNFITFSSNRAGQRNVYVISADGKFSKRLTFGLGNCEAPHWSWASSKPLDLK